MASPRRKAPAGPKAEAPSSPSPEEAAPSAAPAPEPEPQPEPSPEPGPRMETYEAVTPDGRVLVVVRNIETGEATYSPKE